MLDMIIFAVADVKGDFFFEFAPISAPFDYTGKDINLIINKINRTSNYRVEITGQIYGRGIPGEVLTGFITKELWMEPRLLIVPSTLIQNSL